MFEGTIRGMSMKVISGLLKGREIEGFFLKGTRPTMDRVKESLFAIIQEDIKESVVLDLFSGSGNLAIEALSQGAKFCYCNDKSREAVRVILRNIEKFDICNQVEIMNYSFEKCLLYLKNKGLLFDVIFLDPPYDTDYVEKSLKLIDSNQLLREGGIIVCETNDLARIPDNLSFSIVKNKKYGDKYIVILK